MTIQPSNDSRTPFTHVPTEAQRLLDELHSANIQSLFVEGLPATDRKAIIKVFKQKLRHIKGQIKFEKEAIKARWDSRKKDEALAENLYLLPYLTLEKLISQLEIELATLEAAMTTGAPIPEAPKFGEILYSQSTDEGSKTSFQWEVITKEVLALRHEERDARIRRDFAQARELIRQKNYSKARTLLERIDHPKAHEWIVKLNEIEPPSSVGAVLLGLLGQNAVNPAAAYSTLPIVCPKCSLQSAQSIPRSTNTLICPNCKATFTENIYQIRSSRRRSYKRSSRTYEVRVLNSSNTEALLSFRTPYSVDLNLRSKDMAGFGYMDNRLMIVHNFTLNVYWRVASPGDIWKAVVAVVLFIAFVIVYFFMRGSLAQ